MRLGNDVVGGEQASTFARYALGDGTRGGVIIISGIGKSVIRRCVDQNASKYGRQRRSFLRWLLCISQVLVFARGYVGRSLRLAHTHDAP